MKGLSFSITSDDVGIRGDGGLHFRVSKVNDISVVLEQVDLLNCRDGVDLKLLKLGLLK